jgi:NaMN:DMB phosphoribosyltransferase
MAAARARGGGELAVWLAGVTGAERQVVSVRTIDADCVLRARGDGEAGAQPPLTVAEVAHAVDAGRDFAAAAAADGIALLVASGLAADPTPAISLAAALTGDDAAHPLRALRRLGNEEIALLCGVALGAGEHGMGCVCAGLPALAGAAVAAAVEPTLRPRLLAVAEHEQAALLGLATVDASELAAALD